MQTGWLINFAAAHLFLAALFSTYAALRRRSWNSILVALSAVAGLCFVVVIATRASPGSNFAASMLQAFLARDRSAMTTLLLGAAAAAPWVLFALNPVSPSNARGTVARSVLVSVALVGSLAAFITLFVVLLARAQYNNPSFARMLWSDTMKQKGFDLTRIGDVGPNESHPVALAVDENENVYVTYHVYFIGKEHGGVQMFSLNPDGSDYARRTLVDSPILARPFGLAVRSGDLFVSRSGRLGFVSEGEIRHTDAGAVTRIRDLDGNGEYEFMDDILTGMPGSRGPDPQHQNQGIAFTRDGRLLVTNGTPSDHSPPTHPWEGTVLELSADFSQVSVFARGFRNPFGITVTESGNVVATDNDSSSESGDELNHVRRGDHHGHPFDHDPTIPSTGFAKPIFRGPRTGNLVGVVQVPTDHPVAELRGTLLVADHAGDRIWRVSIDETGDEIVVTESEPYFNVPAPLNVAVGPSGTIYVLSYGIYSSSGLYMLTPR